MSTGRLDAGNGKRQAEIAFHTFSLDVSVTIHTWLSFSIYFLYVGMYALESSLFVSLVVWSWMVAVVK